MATRGDLNIVEFDNITTTMPWALDHARRGGAPLILGYELLLTLHRGMFGAVWTWAGTLDGDSQARQRYLDALASVAVSRR